jgi:hypothetical protein
VADIGREMLELLETRLLVFIVNGSIEGKERVFGRPFLIMRGIFRHPNYPDLRTIMQTDSWIRRRWMEL